MFGLKPIKKEELLENGIHTAIDIPEGLFLPYQKAPVIVSENQNTPEIKYKITSMGFSLVPSWSKEAKVKFATHNARIESVLEKPTWKTPFLKQHCVIPISNFYESVYEGPLQGNVISFHKPHHELLFAAGLFDRWNESFSFSILTTEPTPFILEHGHDRCPIFLKLDQAKEWLSLKDDGAKMQSFLLNEFEKPELDVSVHRPLKAGWEKRK